MGIIVIQEIKYIKKCKNDLILTLDNQYTLYGNLVLLLFCYIQQNPITEDDALRQSAAEITEYLKNIDNTN